MNIQFHGTSQQGKGISVPPPPPDVYVLSISPTQYSFPASGSVSESTIVSQVTCSLNGGDTNFTAQVTSDPDGVISTLDTAGGTSGTDIFVTADAWTGEACRGQALITVTCGDQTEILTIYQNGTISNCGE